MRQSWEEGGESEELSGRECNAADSGKKQKATGGFLAQIVNVETQPYPPSPN